MASFAFPENAKAKRIQLVFVSPGRARGRITLRSSAEYLEQLGGWLDRTNTSESTPSKSRGAASAGIREIAWENDLRFA